MKKIITVVISIIMLFNNTTLLYAMNFGTDIGNMTVGNIDLNGSDVGITGSDINTEIIGIDDINGVNNFNDMTISDMFDTVNMNFQDNFDTLNLDGIDLFNSDFMDLNDISNSVQEIATVADTDVLSMLVNENMTTLSLTDDTVSIQEAPENQNYLLSEISFDYSNEANGLNDTYMGMLQDIALDFVETQNNFMLDQFYAGDTSVDQALDMMNMQMQAEAMENDLLSNDNKDTLSEAEEPDFSTDNSTNDLINNDFADNSSTENNLPENNLPENNLPENTNNNIDNSSNNNPSNNNSNKNKE